MIVSFLLFSFYILDPLVSIILDDIWNSFNGFICNQWVKTATLLSKKETESCYIVCLLCFNGLILFSSLPMLLLFRSHRVEIRNDCSLITNSKNGNLKEMMWEPNLKAMTITRMFYQQEQKQSCNKSVQKKDQYLIYATEHSSLEKWWKQGDFRNSFKWKTENKQKCWRIMLCGRMLLLQIKGGNSNELFYSLCMCMLDFILNAYAKRCHIETSQHSVYLLCKIHWKACLHLVMYYDYWGFLNTEILN